MYSDSPLHTPPPPSQFRRPWSPDPYDPLPSNSVRSPQRRQSNNHNLAHDYSQYPHWQQRREASDVSVEALDLADYSRILRARESGDQYPPLSSPPFVPVRALASHDSIQPSSIRSDARSFPSSTRNPALRPFSLPPTSVHPSTSSAHYRRYPHPVQPQARSVESEINVSDFPAWSRNWYKSSNSVIMLNSPPDIYTPLPVSHFNPATIHSPSDPLHGREHPTDVFRPRNEYYDIPTSSLGHDSMRNLLPWSNDPLLDGNAPIDSSVREERMRMLEREFGAQNESKNRLNAYDGLDENGKPLIGSVDQKGRLVTDGPKKRIALRMLQIILTLTAGVPSIYAALIIKPKEAPPPSGKPPAFILYILSVVTFLPLLYLFIFRPCCCPRKRPKSSPYDPLGGGMMVLPIQAIPGGKEAKKKDKKKGKKGGNGEQGKQGNVQVNLIVDPHLFRKEEDESEDGEWDDGAPKRKKRTSRRQSVFAGLALEENWKQARAFTKKLSMLDVAGLTLWGTAFVFILIGKRCPSGGFEGWCNAYNVSSAAACLLSVAFGVSIFFDVKDLYASKLSPRTRA